MKKEDKVAAGRKLSAKEIESVKGALFNNYRTVPEEGTGKEDLPPY